MAKELGEISIQGQITALGNFFGFTFTYSGVLLYESSWEKFSTLSMSQA